jgi:regulatory protein
MSVGRGWIAGTRRARAGGASEAYEAALGRLARRDHSEEEIRRALLGEGASSASVESAIRKLRAERYLDDGGLSARFARSRLQSHGVGRNRIRSALRRRGVDAGAVERGLGEALADVSEVEVLETLAKRFWRERSRDDPRKRLRRLWAFLLRRGFPGALVEQRLRSLWPRWSDALEGLEAPEEGD